MVLDVHYENGSVKHISVSGDIESDSDVKEFLASINEGSTPEIHITFINSSLVCADIVERLIRLQREKICKVYVLKRYLFTYLDELGVKCTYIAKKSFDNKVHANDDGIGSKELSCVQVLQFLNSVYERYGYDYTEYHVDSIIRRIKITMLRENIPDFNDFCNIILQDEELFEQLFLDFSINVTEFFRDPEVFAAIKGKLLPYLDSYAHIKIWCAGCSTGKEPYSLAILLHEAGMLHKSQIYATDINPYVIDEAKNGLFSMNTLNRDIRNYRLSDGQRNFTDYFELKGRYMKINGDLLEKILFFQHSLVGSGILNEFQMILCRNVLIYFNHHLQEKVLKNFYNSLDLSGFLILGKSEGILQNGAHHYFSKYDVREKIFKRKQRQSHEV
ncbi:MAG: protein-glutamate O-methyltransferase CheR [Clostridia bacterium]|nr:protein-glutamate O-methyltransferase CheR [Clostridia bacterium]